MSQRIETTATGKGASPSASSVVDAVVVGAGIVGAAVAAELVRRRPGWRVVVVEKEERAAFHQTGRNSGVVHSGVYYKPGSLKARLCREGIEQVRSFCKANGIRYEQRGKLLVATDGGDEERLAALEARARDNSVPAEALSAERLRQVEPAIVGRSALRIPETAIVDYVGITRSLLAEVENNGGEVRFDAPVTAIERVGGAYRVTAGGRTIETGRLIACGGLASDRIAKMAGVDPEIRILPFRGEYYELSSDLNTVVNHMIYPVPNPALPFLGVHLTPMINGTVTVGPNAVLSLARERYERFAIDPRDAVESLSYPGLWRVLARHPRATWNELRSSLSKRIFLRLVQQYCPTIRMDQLGRYLCGNRAQAVRRDGSLVDDFLVKGSDGLTLVLNAPSPAATCALPIARMLCDMVLDGSSTPENQRTAAS